MALVYLAIILRIFSNPVANMFEKRVAENGSSLYTSMYSYLIMSLCCIPFIFLYNWSNLPQEFWFLTALAGGMCAIGRACMVKALQLGELSVLGPINSYKSVVGLVVGMILLSEMPNIYGLVGMIFIIYGSRFVFETLDEGFSFKLFYRKDIVLRIIALILTGIEAVILKKIILISGVGISFIMWCFWGFIFTLLIILITRHKFTLLKKCEIPDYSAICLGLIIMQVSTNYVFRHMKVGYALSLFQLSSVVNLFFGFKFFNEKDIKKKLIGTLIMILGSVVIILNK